MMIARPLSPDLTDALHAACGEPLPVIDPTNQQLYFVVDRDTHERGMTALRRQDAIESIKRGLEGPSLTLEDSQRLNLQSLRSHAAHQGLKKTDHDAVHHESVFWWPRAIKRDGGPLPFLG